MISAPKAKYPNSKSLLFNFKAIIFAVFLHKSFYLHAVVAPRGDSNPRK